MAYSIKYFKPKIEKEDPLNARYDMQNVNGEYLLFINGVQTTYLPNVWSSLLCKEFITAPSQFIRDNWVNLSFLNGTKLYFNNEAEKFKNSLSLEQQFIVDNTYAKSPKSGVSFVSIKLEGNTLSYSMLGDNFLFIYNNKSKSLIAYCSMVDKNGQLNISQPNHCIYNDLTLLGTPINGKKQVKDCICIILSRDLASWFIDKCRSNLLQTIDTFSNISDDEEYNKLLEKISLEQKYKGNSFKKSASFCTIIKRDNSDVDTSVFDNILVWCKKYITEGLTWCKSHIVACLIAIALIITSISSILFIFGNNEKNEEIKEEITSKEETKSSDNVSVRAIVTDDYKYYHDKLADNNLTFKSVKEMLVKADAENLKEKNKDLYDTIYSYAHFVNRYNIPEIPRLKVALIDLFSDDRNGVYTICRNDSITPLVLSTNISSGEILLFRDSHKRKIIELFIGKYGSDDQIQQYA